MNPIQMIQNFMKNGGNPQQLILKTIKTAGDNNPMVSNLIQMANSGNMQGVEQFARNYMKGKGRDFDKEFASFMSNFNK